MIWFFIDFNWSFVPGVFFPPVYFEIFFFASALGFYIVTQKLGHTFGLEKKLRVTLRNKVHKSRPCLGSQSNIGPPSVMMSALFWFFSPLYLSFSLPWLRSVWHLPFLVRRWNLHIVATWEITMLHIIAADAFVVLGRQNKRTHERFFFFLLPQSFSNVGQQKKSFF